MTAADLLVDVLKRHGIDWMATLCGHGLDPLFQAACTAGMRLVDTRNEQTAAYIAHAYGCLTRRPGVCAVSSGVAHVNALTGVANAWFDSAPMLLLSGAGAFATTGLGHFQDMDQVTIARSLCRYARVVDHPDRVVQILTEALEAATGDPPGPVHLTVPMDIQRTEVAEAAVVPRTRRTASGGSDESAEDVASALAQSRAPLVIAGNGVFYADAAAAMLRFCRRYSIPVTTPIWDRGCVDQPDPLFVGVVGAATGGPDLLNEADCILMAGAESDYRVGYLRRPSVRPDVRICFFRRSWDALAEACEGRVAPSTEWLAEATRRRDAFRAGIEKRAEEQARAGLHAVHIIRAIESVLGADPILLVDGGSIGQWAHQLLCSNRYPGHWLTCGRSGVVGWGVAGGMAARVAFPNRPVILLSGDGAFTFNVADLESAARQSLGFVAIVADDQGWGITRTGHVRQFGAPIASSLGPIAFDDLARSLGAQGVRATEPDAIARELRRAMDSPALTVIHVPVVGGNP